MVAAAKVRKVQDRVTAFRPYSEKIQEVFSNLSSKVAGEDISEPLLLQRDVKTVGLVVVTSDKGLCGSYNSNLVRFANAEIKKFEAQGYKVKLWLIGNKSFAAFKYTGHEIIEKYSQIPQIATTVEANMIQENVISNYLSENVDKVVIIYTKFVSMMTTVPSRLDLVPVITEGQTSDSMAQYVFEPNAQAMMSAIIPKYIESQILRALLESSASELASRMTAMSSASKNAKEMIFSLNLVYNKVRQAAITKEILEVVGGAEALES